MVNRGAIRHYFASPFREMKKVRTNRQPDVSSLRLIEFKHICSRVAWEISDTPVLVSIKTLLSVLAVE